jgi:hypothetical protein
MAAMAAKSTAALAGWAAVSMELCSSAEQKSAGGTGCVVSTLAWRTDSCLATTGSLITAAAAELFFVVAGGRESASAITLECPEVCLRSEVNSAKKERWRCWRPAPLGCNPGHCGDQWLMIR